MIRMCKQSKQCTLHSTWHKKRVSVCYGSMLLLSGLIKLVSKHRAQVIYTRNTKGTDEVVPEKEA